MFLKSQTVYGEFKKYAVSSHTQTKTDFVIICTNEIIMQGTKNITYPEYLAHNLMLSNKDFETEMKISSLVKHYELGKVSFGFA